VREVEFGLDSAADDGVLVVSIKGQASTHHQPQDDADGPQVRLATIACNRTWALNAMLSHTRLQEPYLAWRAPQELRRTACHTASSSPHPDAPAWTGRNQRSAANVTVKS
jgi:hypothetical protein